MAKLKSTEVIEQERLQLWKDYQVYLKVENSEKLKEYLSLKEKVESASFQRTKKEVESLQLKGSPTEVVMKEFASLEKNKNIKVYFNVLQSNELVHLDKMKQSGIPKRFEEVKQFVKSGEYKREMKRFKQRKAADKELKDVWENSEAHKKFVEYNELQQSSDILLYYRFLDSRNYKIYKKVDNSALLHQYEDLKKEINSDEFKKQKQYLEDPKRYEKTEDFMVLKKFEAYNEDAEIQLYLKHHNKDSFKFFRNWELIFEDDFNAAIDPLVWSNVTPIAQKGPGKPFAIPGQISSQTNGKNFEVRSSILTLTTRRENNAGLAWDEKYGFVEKEFQYSAGLIHSLNYFKEEYGYYEVKVKNSKVKGVISNISLVDENEETCIRIYSTEGNRAYGGIIYTSQDRKNKITVKMNNRVKGYVIVGLKWTPDQIEWKVNDRTMGIITPHTPHTKLGIRIDTEVIRETSKLPHRLDIDWIKCYKRKE